MSTATAAQHTADELTFVGADDLTEIVTFTAPSRHAPGRLNSVSLDTTTGEAYCDCRAGECGKACWHVALVALAWYRTPAMLDTLWLTDRELAAYGKKLGAMVRVYRARTGRVLRADQVNLVAARSEWRRRAALAPAPVAADDLPLAA